MTTDLWYSWITAQVDRTEHAVTDDSQVAGMAAGDGMYEPMCGTRFLAASMDAAPHGRCLSCLAFLHARAELRDFGDRIDARRPGWLSRLFCHRRQPADVGGSPSASTSAGLHRRRGRHEA